MRRLIMPLLDDDDYEPSAEFALVELDDQQIRRYMVLIELFAGLKTAAAPLKPWTMRFQVPCPRCCNECPEFTDAASGDLLFGGDEDFFDLETPGVQPAHWKPAADDQPDVRCDAHLRFDTNSVCLIIYSGEHDNFAGMTIPLSWWQLAEWAGSLTAEERARQEHSADYPVPNRSITLGDQT